MPLRAILRSPLAAALSAPHGIDAYLRALDPRWAVHDVRATIESIVRETPSVATLVLRPNLAWDGHRAGQHVQVSVDIAGVRHTRTFSVSSSAKRRDRIAITVRAVGLVSRHLVFDARPGDVLSLSQAQGEFVLPERRPERLLFVSGGSGITPVMSMMRTLLDEGHRGEIVFLTYARSHEERIYARELDALSSRVVMVQMIGGVFSPEHLAMATPEWARFETYLCGPEPMMAAVRSAIGKRVHEERFGAELVASSNDTGGDVHFAKSNVRKACDGRTLLVLAEDAGLAPEHGCRRGICHGCTRRKVRGTVRDLRTGTLSDARDEDIQICVTTPVGDVTLDL